jgi:SOS-response transcriptional repressor LexA
MQQPHDDVTEKVYEFIRDYIRTHQLNPTLREIGSGCFISTSTVSIHLARLEAKEWIVREPQLSRSIRLGSRAPDFESE